MVASLLADRHLPRDRPQDREDVSCDIGHIRTGRLAGDDQSGGATVEPSQELVEIGVSRADLANIDDLGPVIGGWRGRRRCSPNGRPGRRKGW